ncbi:hypothetical protein, partial [Streptomyces sp. NPDC096153]|uniref:hypothetical protein n=1 Tax=Streptomyces sp. NPDC096153 TaxID=3155548 RepID=UPI00331C7A42
DGHPAHAAARTRKDQENPTRNRRSEFTRWIEVQHGPIVTDRGLLLELREKYQSGSSPHLLAGTAR